LVVAHSLERKEIKRVWAALYTVHPFPVLDVDDERRGISSGNDPKRSHQGRQWVAQDSFENWKFLELNFMLLLSFLLS
jgi:hypothetical protein